MLALAPFSLVVWLAFWGGGHPSTVVAAPVVGVVMALGYVSAWTTIRAVRVTSEYLLQHRSPARVARAIPSPHTVPALPRPIGRFLSLPRRRRGRTNPVVVVAPEDVALGNAPFEEKAG